MSKYLKNIVLFLLIILTVAFCSCSGQKTTIDDACFPDDTGINYGSESIDHDDTDIDSISESETTEPVGLLYGKKIVLDPGHGAFSENYKEPVAPGSSEMKSAFSTGTSGAFISEAEFNLIIAQKIAPLLIEEGANVYFTRNDDNSVSNVDRALFANDLNADLAVRIHADGSSDTSLYGISVLVPAEGVIEQELVSLSRSAGESVLDSLIEATDANNRGVIERYDLTGFNWSKVPVILVECGFMSNPNEDALLSNPLYQDRIASGIADGIIEYFKNH